MAKEVTWRFDAAQVPKEGRFDVPDEATTHEIKEQALQEVWGKLNLIIEVRERQRVAYVAVSSKKGEGK